jgi:hypothetical protein
MEFLVTAITLTLLVGLLISPILLLRFINRTNIKYKFVSYLTIGLFLTALITIIFAWWSYTSDMLLLKQYGYDINGMNKTEIFGKVLPENLNKVKSLEKSIMGIGWPLKAIMTFEFYSPYLLIIYGVTYLIGRKTQKVEL